MARLNGESPQDILAAHVSKNPVDLGVLRPDAPEQLRVTVMRCLKKNPYDRWPDADALTARLDALITPSGGSTPAALVAQQRNRLWRRPSVWIPAVALAVAAVALFTPRSDPAAITVQRQQITFAGNVIESAIAADGEWLAYVTSDSAGQALFVRDLSSTTAIELDRGDEVAGLTWSNDGSEIAYHVGGADPVIRALPRLGGAGRVLGRGHWLPSPDFSRLATFKQGGAYVTIANRLEGDTVRLERPAWVRWTNRVAWSPDSRQLAVEVAQPNQATYAILVTNDLPGQRDFVETVRDSVIVSEPSFSRDGRFIYYIRQPGGELPSLMRIGVTRDGRPAGEPRLVFQAFDGDARPGFYRSSFLNRLTHASDGQIAFVRTDGESNVWVIDVGDESAIPTPRRITTGSAVHSEVSFSPTGEQIALVRTTRIAMTIGVMPANGGAIQPLAETTVQGEVAWSASGKQLAFVQGPRDDLHVAVHNVESGATRVVTEHNVSADLTWAGARIVAQGIGNRKLLLIDPETGREEALVSDSLGFNFRPRASPDGRRLVFYRNWRGRGIWLLDLGAGEPARQLLSADVLPLRFDETGNVLYVTDGRLRDDGVRRVLRLTLSTGELESIITLPCGFVAQDITPDGRQVVATQIQWRGDVWQMTPSGR